MIKFLNEEHKKRYEECIEKDKTFINDNERKGMFYILSSNEDIYKKINDLYDFTSRAISFEKFFKAEGELSSAYIKMVYLAYQLYNNFKYSDFDRKDLSIIDILARLDKDNFDVCCYALKIRFNNN